MNVTDAHRHYPIVWCSIGRTSTATARQGWPSLIHWWLDGYGTTRGDWFEYGINYPIHKIPYDSIAHLNLQVTWIDAIYWLTGWCRPMQIHRAILWLTEEWRPRWHRVMTRSPSKCGTNFLMISLLKDDTEEGFSSILHSLSRGLTITRSVQSTRRYENVPLFCSWPFNYSTVGGLDSSTKLACDVIVWRLSCCSRRPSVNLLSQHSMSIIWKLIGVELRR